MTFIIFQLSECRDTSSSMFFRLWRRDRKEEENEEKEEKEEEEEEKEMEPNTSN